MIVVTGGAGFIGSRLVKALNARGHKNILVVDDLSQGAKFSNLVDCHIADYCDKQDFLQQIKQSANFAEPIEVIFHQGACSDTMEWDGVFMMQNNYEYSKALLHYCVAHALPLIYASSAAVYGCTDNFSEQAAQLRPLNLYGYSKLLFDHYVQGLLDSADSQIVGLRYFNVYGPGEDHKGKMMSVVRHFINQLHAENKITIFSDIPNCAPGAQQRDFIFIDDVVKLNLWLWDNPQVSGIYNAGTGVATDFQQIAQSLIELHGSGEICYQPIAQHLREHYQIFTQANLQHATRSGLPTASTNIQQGITNYFQACMKSACK
jgi:ADP-L-glycero-D-manno-heptose 6-epimerase